MFEFLKFSTRLAPPPEFHNSFNFRQDGLSEGCVLSKFFWAGGY